jgi:hypothetical protein
MTRNELIEGLFLKLTKILVGNKAFENLSVFLISPVTRGGKKLVVEFKISEVTSMKIYWEVREEKKIDQCCELRFTQKTTIAYQQTEKYYLLFGR